MIDGLLELRSGWWVAVGWMRHAGEPKVRMVVQWDPDAVIPPSGVQTVWLDSREAERLAVELVRAAREAVGG